MNAHQRSRHSAQQQVQPPGTGISTNPCRQRDVPTIVIPSSKQRRGRLLNIVELQYDGLVYSVRRLPSTSELAAAAKEYKSKEEAMPHAKCKCEYHKGVIRRTNAYREHITNKTKTEEEMSEGLHDTEACLAFQQPYIYCTKHIDGPPGIIQIYQTDDTTISKKRWEQAADSVNKRIADEGDRVTCVFNSLVSGFGMHAFDGDVAYAAIHMDKHGDAMDPNQ